MENASTTTAPSLDKRTAKLEKAVLQRADELRRAALKVDFQKPPGKFSCFPRETSKESDTFESRKVAVWAVLLHFQRQCSALLEVREGCENPDTQPTIQLLSP